MELKRCPYCGAKPRIVFRETDYRDPRTFIIRDKEFVGLKCNCGGKEVRWRKSIEKAIEVWNFWVDFQIEGMAKPM